jgi:UDP-glucuronate 4-epimerase
MAVHPASTVTRKRVLVTGGAGFIGSHVCEALLARGNEIAIIDDLNDFYCPAEKRRNLDSISRLAAVRFTECDICDQNRVYALVESFRPAAIVHLAARAGVRPSLDSPLLYESVNVRGTLTMLEAARKFGVEQFVFASSSSVYGASTLVPFRENAGELLPVSPYAATKIAGEKLCFTYSHLFGIRAVCLRFFTVYGPRQRPDLAIRKFAELIDRGEPVPVFGDGSTSRDYTFVKDAAAGVMSALAYQGIYDIFNIGNSTPIALADLVCALENLLGRRAKIAWRPPQPGDVPVTCADTGKTCRELGFSACTKFRDGLAEFVKWYREIAENAFQAAS